MLVMENIMMMLMLQTRMELLEIILLNKMMTMAVQTTILLQIFLLIYRMMMLILQTRMQLLQIMMTLML
jgi:hypothetical protein